MRSAGVGICALRRCRLAAPDYLAAAQKLDLREHAAGASTTLTDPLIVVRPIVILAALMNWRWDAYPKR